MNPYEDVGMNSNVHIVPTSTIASHTIPSTRKSKASGLYNLFSDKISLSKRPVEEIIQDLISLLEILPAFLSFQLNRSRKA